VNRRPTHDRAHARDARPLPGSNVSGQFRVIVCFLIERGGHVLFLKRTMSKDEAPGQWETGSGRVEQGEPPVQAVLREAREETGLNVEVLWPLDTYHFYRGPLREETIGITFHCRASEGEVVLSPEHDDAKWVPIEHLHEVDCPEWVRRSLETFLTRQDWPDARGRQ
jgi:8-oxo-dGTP diphosphatase